MLPPYIIEQLRERERQEREQTEQPCLELELPLAPRERARRHDDVDSGERGVHIISLFD